MAVRTDRTTFGSELKRWRTHRRFSQLELANRAEVSQRHLSFLETGRSRPSPEMVEHLAVALDIPLRARNGLLQAAGFAPAYSETPLDGPEVAHLRASLERLVEAHDPYPAYVVDRSWNIQIANTAAALLTGMLVEPDHALALGGNVLRLFLHPDGARHAVTNWDEAATVLVERLAAEVGADPTDDEVRELYEEVTAYAGVVDLRNRDRRPSDVPLLTDIHVRHPGGSLRFYTTISSLAAASDVTLAELRLETLLPADEGTADALRALRAGESTR